MIPRTRTTHIVFLIVGIAFIAIGAWMLLTEASALMWLWPAAGLFLMVRSILALRKAPKSGGDEPPASH